MLIGRQAGLAFWVPGALGSTWNCVVIPERLGSDGCWLLAGVYADQGALRAGVQVPPARQLLAMPGVIDLACGAPQPLASARLLPAAPVPVAPASRITGQRGRHGPPG